jgi:transcriptional regulator with XRE-family HTH domain
MTAKLFRLARKALGINQSELARLLGVTRATVSNWERSAPPRVAGLAMHTLGKSISSQAKVRAEESGNI